MVPQSLKVIDSHTAGEPTRTVVGGLEQLDDKSAVEIREYLHHKADWVRTSLISEPRGSDVMVGSVLLNSSRDDCIASVVFFNNVGYLGMCGHGLIGVVTTMAFQNQISAGVHHIETPVGVVRAELLSDGRVRFENVASYVYRSDVEIEVPRIGKITGDIAWGGNWFFLSQGTPEPICWEARERLTAYAIAVRKAAEDASITGEDGALIDHYEFFRPALDDGADADNFVLCPGSAFDRSPCGTGTSAKLACLAAHGELQEGDVWRQRSITGGVFEGRFRKQGNSIIPEVTGKAYVNGISEIIFSSEDSLATGLCERTSI